MGLLLLLGGAGFRGALDSLGTSLESAWSVSRRLRTSYASSIIRVRRGSDNVEQDFGYLANGNVDVAAVASFCGAGDGFLTTIYDQSGNARNLIQATTTLQPIVCESGVAVTENGRLSAKLVAANSRRMAVASSQSIYNFLHTTAGFLSSVAKANNTAAFKAIAGNRIDNNESGFYFWRSSNEAIGMGTSRRDVAGVATSGATSSIAADAGTALTTNAIVSAQYDADNATAASRLFSWQNGTLLSVSNAETATPFTENAGRDFTFGSNGAGVNPFDGTISELIVWSSLLSEANRKAIEANQSAFYGITVSA